MEAPNGSPLFIIGSPRSGTTLLRLMLTCHRNIVIPPECGFAMWLEQDYAAWDRADDEDLTQRFVADVLRSRKFETWNLQAGDLLACIRSELPGSYAELVGAVYRCFARRQKPGFTRWGDKNNYYLNHIPRLKALFPSACFIHIVRDPRSVACSYLELSEKAVDSTYAPRLETELSRIVEAWKSNIATIRSALGALAGSVVSEVRFEDLVREPEASLSTLCADIGEEFDPAMLDYHEVNRETNLEPAEFLRWKAKTLEPPQLDRVDRYRRDLTAEQIRFVERAVESELAAYGY